ncbi:MAG TPA: hypothetical protein VFA35_00600 [Burkholderiaceae bacterium]|nr:hypothetical protein [Burkholderiaceae bacterium]
MACRGEKLRAAAAALLLYALASWPALAAPDFGAEHASDDARYAAARVLATADHQQRPFAIVDKRDARIYVFEASGQLAGASSALLGLAPGDTAVADIAQRLPASLAPHERSTPSGRFESQPGHNDKGEAIVWVDYAAALAIHRLRPAPADERRAERLASATPDDNRISLGCIVVPVAFYEAVVEPALGRQRGVVYVLPETRPVQALFGADPLQLAKR